MNADRWSRVQELFHAALELRPEQRTPFLDDACGGDQALLTEITSLLTFSQNEGAMERLSNRLITPLTDSLREIAPHEVEIGPYRTVATIGYGGMGTVYLAERSDGQFEQLVALKLIRVGNLDHRIRDRFLQERNILAKLQHPNIARLLDGGVTDEGRPYFAMEFIEGVPIDEFADSGEIDVDSRLNLFTTVCDAVQYAHQNLIVHRDLKPANILISNQQQVKLLDFGIAKLLDPAEEQTSDASADTLFAMTPAYASPEQACGENVTTASDVYSLGVILYQLLTGYRPYRVAGRSPAQIEKAICEQEPMPPSRAVVAAPPDLVADQSELQITHQQRCKQRGGSADQLRRKLSGDLDAIVLKALSKEPDRRYASVQQLRQDIDHLLQGRPVIARAATWSYRAMKFWRRNRLVTTIGAVAIVSLIGGIATTTWQARQTKQQAEIAKIERDRAQREAVKSQKIVEYLVGLFGGADPDRDDLRELTAKELLGRGAAQLEGELLDEPQARAALLEVIGRVHRNLGDYAAAESHLRMALSLTTETADADRHAIADVQGLLASVLIERGEYAQAEILYRSAKEAHATGFGATDIRLLTDQKGLGVALYYQGDYTAAQDILADTLSKAESLGEESEILAGIASDLAVVLNRLAKYSEAQSLLRRAFAIHSRISGPESIEATTDLNNLASSQWELGELGESLASMTKALALFRKRYGDSHAIIAIARNNLGNVLQDLGRLDEAESMYRMALEIRTAKLGPDHPETAMSRNNLAALLLDRGQTGAAAPLLKKACADMTESLGPQHANSALCFNNLGRLHHAVGEWTLAEPVLRENLRLRRELHGDSHPRTAMSLLALAGLLRDKGEYPEALPLFQEALQIRRQAFHNPHWIIADAEHELARCLIGVERFADAEALLTSSLETLTQQHGKTALRTTLALETLDRLQADRLPESTKRPSDVH